MAARLKITIVGAGIMGLSTAHTLAKAGHAVTVLDQADAIPNPAGSSVDHHRLIRYPYGGHKGYAAMVVEAFDAWDRLWADLRETLYVETGTLAIGSGAQPWITESAEDLESVNVPYSWVAPRDLAEQFPVLTGTDVAHAFFTPTGGALLAEQIVIALASRLERLGGTLRCGAQVVACDPHTRSVTLADGEGISADRLVIAAGPWLGKLMPTLADRATPSRQAVVYLRPPPALASVWSRMPMVLDIAQDAGFYTVPPMMGLDLKIGDHCFTMTGDPDEDRVVAADTQSRIAAEAAGKFAQFDQYQITSAKSCFYTVEPDEAFIVEPLAAHAWVVSGCSGHGFKFGALMGERVASALTEQVEPASVTRWARGLMA